MNILFVSTIFPDTLHPARGTFNYELCLALRRLGADVRVIAPQAWPEVWRNRLSGKTSQAPASLLQAQLKAEYPTYWYPPKMGREMYGSCYWRSIQGSVRRMLQNWQPDFVLSYWVHPDGEVGLRIARKTGAHCGVIVGGSDVLLLPNSPARRQRVTRVLAESDLVLTVSQRLAEVVQELGAKPTRTVPVYQGVDPNRFQLADKVAARRRLGKDATRPLLVWVGRMVPVKNLDMLIAAAEIKAKRGDDFELCLLGDGPERPRIAKLIESKGLTTCVSLVGSVGHQDLPCWYQAADVTVLCSHSEGLPNVFRESLACGTPFVSTDVGSISEIADPNYAMLVPPDDAVALADAIDQILQGPHQEQAGLTEARTWNHMASEVLELIEGLQQKPNNIAMAAEPILK